MIAIKFALVGVLGLLSFQGVEKLETETFEATLARILPEELELRWKDVDWRVALADGIRDAQVEGKPILLWAMNGHPLGCV